MECDLCLCACMNICMYVYMYGCVCVHTCVCGCACMAVCGGVTFQQLACPGPYSECEESLDLHKGVCVCFFMSTIFIC